ncbi:MAG: SUMF1/EgtB/PvdO family nonheme iron enzyme [Granulosicoccus sp.]
MKIVPAKILCLLVLLLPCGAVWAEQARLALVIGNSDYEESPLKNPINDANDMAVVLEELGFDVILSTNANRREMGRAIRQFGRKLKADRGVGLFYYAGHGIQIENRNFLIPIDTPLEEEDEVPYESIDVGSVLSKMESAGNALNLIILDACRNNPFPQSFRSTNRGLARVEAPIGSLVVYATAPGAVAADGDGRNGVFTGALLNELRTDGLSLTQIVRRTRAAVVKASNGQQVPWESSSLLKDFYFRNEAEKPAQQAASNPTSGASNTQAEPEPDTAANLPAKENEVSAELVHSEKTSEKPDVKPLPDNQTAPGVADDVPIAPEPPEKPVAENSSEAEPITLASLDESQQIKTKPPAAKTTTVTTPIIEAAPEPRKTKKPGQSAQATLTVEVDPPDARIRIMNIVDKYTPGILLDKSRSYDIYVTHSGYTSFRESISLTDDATSLNIRLNKKGITEPEMVAIAGGSFTMGCTKGDKQCESYEKPARSVRLSPYYISATEITVGQFQDFVDSTGYKTDAEKNSDGNQGCFMWSDSGGISRSEAKWEWNKKHNWLNPGFQQTASHPVTCVSWNDANNYAQWLAIRTGRPYALPSESEWEFAARAVSQGKFGEASSARGLCAIANVADNTQSPSGSKWGRRINCTDYHWYSAPVASYQANGFGLYDMQGNVWEWVADAWSDNLSDIPGNGNPNISASDNDARVLRGGGWDSDDKRTRMSSRSRGNSASRASMTGFRVVIRRNDR